MTTTFYCHHCGGKMKVSDEYAGRSGSCTHCGGKISVPVTEAQAPYVQTGTRASRGKDRPQLGVAKPPAKPVWLRVPVVLTFVLLVAVIWGAAGILFSRYFGDAVLVVSSLGDKKSYAQSPSDVSLRARIADLLPTAEEDRYLRIPWRTNLMEARVEASAQRKPIFMWVMNGDPLGCV